MEEEEEEEEEEEGGREGRRERESYQGETDANVRDCMQGPEKPGLVGRRVGGGEA